MFGRTSWYLSWWWVWTRERDQVPTRYTNESGDRSMESCCLLQETAWVENWKQEMNTTVYTLDI